VWLPKDERRLLAGYYRNVGEQDLATVRRGGCFAASAYQLDEIVKLLRRGRVRISQYGQAGREHHGTAGAVEERKDAVCEFVGVRARAEQANQLLARRQLLALEDHEAVRDVRVVTLTLAGYDLGRQYSKWWDRTGLWFKEYRNHWVWLIGSLLGGVLGALLIEWAKRGFGWK
jgi:hypothetical protein